MPWIKDHGPSEEGGYRGIMFYPRLLSLGADGKLRIAVSSRGGVCQLSWHKLEEGKEL